jgi:phosphatidylglycerol:prolipoprotein diacylglycerol transferase
LIHLMMLPALLPFPDIDPVIVRIGPLAIHWYGLGYVVGILFAWFRPSGFGPTIARP